MRTSWRRTSGHSDHIIIFSDEEEDLVNSILTDLDTADRQHELSTVNTNQIALETLARSISMYPSILKKEKLGRSSRNIDSLLESLCTRAIPDMILHIPTKAILGRAYSIAKINFFIMMRYIIEDIEELSDRTSQVLSIIGNNVFVLTAEEVFTSIVEDFSSPEHIRHNAAYLLAHTWEYRLDYGVREFAPILQNLWRAREKLIPNFGTMLGFSELCTIAGTTETTWLDYLNRNDITEEEIYALEEFIFGLTYEEILALREYLDTSEKQTINREDITEILGPGHTIPYYESDDPRELYRSFRDRKVNARFRSRAKTPGPRKTFEEYLMNFLLSTPEK